MLEMLSPLSRLLSSLLNRLRGGSGSAPSKIMVAPAYDAATAALSRCVSSLPADGAEVCFGNDARHGHVIALVSAPSPSRKLLMFAGHGKAAGLLTEPSLGKVDSPLCSDRHGCFMDTEDINEAWRGLHVVAWACEAGVYFGPRIATLKDSAFLGFAGPLNIVINHRDSEQKVWLPIMRDLFTRVSDRGGIESHDAEWLRHYFLDLGEKIDNGSIDTGVHNLINAVFLKAAAKATVVHVSQG